MPRFNQFTKHLLDKALLDIKEAVYEKQGDLAITAWWSREPLPFTRRTQGKKVNLRVGDQWGRLFDCAWFHFKGTVPAGLKGKKCVLRLVVSGELCVFDKNGVPIRGLTTGTITQAAAPGGGYGEKRVFPVTGSARGGERIDLWADAGQNDLFGNFTPDGVIREACLAVCHEEVRQLYFDYEILLGLMKELPETSARQQQLLQALSEAAAIIYPACTEASAAAARKILKPQLAKKGGDPTLTVSAIGHAHIDLAWLWPIRETKRKTARTFATVIANMKQDASYRFGASQPQQFEWLKMEHPALYREVQKRVREKRFEVQGGMWVEADTNLAGGEALVRQFLYGKRFFKKEFNVEVRNHWLPDVFGYNAALPQILKKAGVDYFMTQKLSWSKINRFPHHSFWWQGVDGTKVLACMLPEDDYNSPVLPAGLLKAESNYKDKNVSDRTLMLFGIGDGGGGPGEDHLERLRRVKNLLGLPRIQQERACDFFEEWKKDAGKFATWAGELYLEFHQGTFTTEARNKWYNRKMEFALRDCEWALLLAGLFTGKRYPQAELDKTWKEMLLYQFHDILPGSSIKRVYDESVARYAVLHSETETRTADSLSALALRIDTRKYARPAVVFNSLPWTRDEWVRAGSGWAKVSAPSMGWQAAETAAPVKGASRPTASVSLLENDLLRVRFHADGSVVSVFDKEANREVVTRGEKGNRLAVYDDKGDAWDFAPTYAEQAPRYMALKSASAKVDGPCAVLRQVYVLGHSTLTQEITLQAGSRRLDFASHLSWRETNTMLRVKFPVDIAADEAAYEIQYGHVKRPAHRNTSWDLAKDEVPAQKWADLSENGYGVALLNDSKYGYKVKDGVLELALLRSVLYPGCRVVAEEGVKPGRPHHAYTDQCEHRFTYALFPHAEGLGSVIRAAYELNVPLRAVSVAPKKGVLPAETSLLKLDAQNIIIEAVKKAEDSKALIVRMYESEGKRTSTSLTLGFTASKAVETDLMERETGKAAFSGKKIRLKFRPFEIKTVHLSPLSPLSRPSTPLGDRERGGLVTGKRKLK